MPFVQEIGSGTEAIIKVGTSSVGLFEATQTQDRWKWTSGSWFPSGGFALWIQSSGSVENPSVILPAYDFLTSTQVPTQMWQGSSLFEMKLNTTLVGWAEVLVSGSNVKMMWWSNGSNLVDNRIKCSPGQILSYIPAALPTKPQRPLAQPQVN